jgi:hypothetical protein
MKRPNKDDYLTTNQFTYREKLNEYYDELEKYIDYLERQFHLDVATAIVMNPDDISYLKEKGIIKDVGSK